MTTQEKLESFFWIFISDSEKNKFFLLHEIAKQDDANLQLSTWRKKAFRWTEKSSKANT